MLKQAAVERRICCRARLVILGGCCSVNASVHSHFVSDLSLIRQLTHIPTSNVAVRIVPIKAIITNSKTAKPLKSTLLKLKSHRSRGSQLPPSGLHSLSCHTDNWTERPELKRDVMCFSVCVCDGSARGRWRKKSWKTRFSTTQCKLGKQRNVTGLCYYYPKIPKYEQNTIE